MKNKNQTPPHQFALQHIAVIHEYNGKTEVTQERIDKLKSAYKHTGSRKSNPLT